MPIPAAIVTAVTMAASNEQVQKGAMKLLKDVYGRFGPRVREDVAPQPEENLQTAVAALATRDELAASFAVLQAEMDRRHRITAMLVGGVLALQALLTVMVLSILFG